MMQKVILSALILCFPILVAAQSQVITIEDAIEIALENNYQLKQAENNLSISELQELSAKADFFPSLNANVNRGLNIGRRFDTETTGQFVDVTTNNLSASLSSNIDIFNGFANINNLRRSREITASREELLQRVRENVIFSTASSYLDYLLSFQLLEIAEENLQTSQSQLEQIEAQVEVGSRPMVDLLNQESLVANNELDLVNRENEVDLARLSLIRILQIDPLGEYEFVIPEIAQGSAVPINYDLGELVGAALENRADLRSEQRAILAEEYQVKIAKAQYYPTISGSASIRSNYSDLSMLSYTDQFFDQNVARSFGISLSIPIFNRLNARTNVEIQKINLKNAELGLENTRLQVIQEVNQAYRDYLARVKEVESTQRALDAAERAYETELQRYEVGASTLIELSLANNAYVQAQASQAQATYRFIFQEKLLDYFIGRMDENISLESY
ncbi:MAG TPA: TolC family protein [Balneolaceae bacterium]|nr:TolC family protein [Balneolaceae bacterium]